MHYPPHESVRSHFDRRELVSTALHCLAWARQPQDDLGILFRNWQVIRVALVTLGAPLEGVFTFVIRLEGTVTAAMAVDGVVGHQAVV